MKTAVRNRRKQGFKVSEGFEDFKIAAVCRYLETSKPRNLETVSERLLLQFRQLLGRDLHRRRAGVVFLDLLVEAFGVERLVAGLVKFCQLQLRRHFAH